MGTIRRIMYVRGVLLDARDALPPRFVQPVSAITICTITAVLIRVPAPLTLLSLFTRTSWSATTVLLIALVALTTTSV